MKAGYNQNLNNNNYLKSNSVSISGMKRLFKNIDNNLNDSDSDEEHKERTQKVINDKFKSSNSNAVIDNISKNRIKKFNVNRSNREKNNMKRKMDNPNTNNNINFNRGYSAQINDNFYNSNNYTNVKRSLSGEKNYKPMNNLYNLTEEKKYNSINRITSYNSKYNKSNRNIQSNFLPPDTNYKIIPIPKNNSDENKDNLYPTFDNDDNLNNNSINSNFNSTYNNKITNNFYPNQTQNFNSNNMTSIKNNYMMGMSAPPIERKDPIISNNNNYNYNNTPFQSSIPQSISSINNITPDYGLSRGNNTIGYLTYKKQNILNNVMDNNNNYPNYKTETKPGIINMNQSQPPFPMANTEDDDDGRFHELSITKRFSSLNNPIGFDQALKQQQMNNKGNINPTGRRTFIKKLPPLNEEKNNLNLITGNNSSSGPLLNNQINRNSFGNNINIKKIPLEAENNNNILLQRANVPINNMVPNAASFNPRMQNLNKLNDNNNNNSENINQIMSNQQQINYNLNNQIIPQKDVIEKNENSEDLQQNNENIEQNQENENEQQNEENVDENGENKDPNISYNEFDFSGLLKNYGGLTRQGIDASGRQKTNQDNLVSITNINNIKDFNIFGVLDGHGPEGHYVSQFASEFIPSQIINNEEIKELKDPELIYQKLKENNCQIITECFLSCDEQLKKENFDAYSSGTTCNLIIHVGQHILCANVGDSRSLVAYDDNNEDQELKYLEQAQLSIDYKPDIEEEKNRILLSGGFVEQMKNELGQGVGPYRVWVKSQDYPGLAMSRSIGDLKGKTVGVIAEPGILEYDLNETTKFIVIASDGVWEFLKNEDIVEIGKNFYLDNNTSALCHQIVDTSVAAWREKDVVVDDITVVVMFF